MATYSLAKYQSVRNRLDGEKSVISTYVDMTDADKKMGLPATGFTTGDILEVCPIGKGCLVTDVILDRRTAEGAADTIDIGYGGSTAYWFDDVALNATTALKNTANSTAPLAFTANDTIDIVNASAALTAAQFYIHVVYIRPTMVEA